MLEAETSRVMRRARWTMCAPALVLIATLSACSRRAPAPGPVVFDPDSIPEAYARSTAALMFPGASRAFQVTPEGDLYNGDWMVRLRPSADDARAEAPRVIAYEKRWMPVARWARSNGEVRWEFEAVALAGPASRDTGLIVSLEATATNRGSAAHQARLEIAIGSPEIPAVWVTPDAPADTALHYRWAGGPVDSAYGWCEADPGSKAGGPAPDRVVERSFRLGPGESRHVRLVLPAYPENGATLEAWARAPHGQRVEETRRYWNGALDRGARFHLGDPEVEDALRGALVVLLACRERHGTRWFPIGGPFHYRDVWLRDGARAIAALSVAGFTAEARDCAEGFTVFQWPNGALISQRGQLDGSGQALWAFEQALLRPAPAESVAAFAARAERTWRWWEWQRGLGRATGWPFGAMMPFADPRDAEYARAQLVGNDAWALAGYQATARLLRAAGRTALADSVEASRAVYLADFERALARSGSRDLPPSWQGIGHEWGNVAVAYPCGALDPHRARCRALARRIWAGSGGAGLAFYHERDSLAYYLGTDLGTWALLAGERAAADSVLEASLHWRTASGGAGEFFTRDGRFGVNLPPHATSAAVLVALIRNCVIFDDGDTLRLTMGAREGWWREARVEDAPTRWGAVNLEFRRAGETAEWRWTPVPVWTALTLPPGTRLAGRPEPPLVRGPDDTIALAPPQTASARVRVVAAGAGR